MKEIFKGALLGFALGDALGNSVADLSKKEIQNRWGSSGISRPNRHPVLNSFSNSGLTEEMCFILDGLLWANRVNCTIIFTCSPVACPLKFASSNAH